MKANNIIQFPTDRAGNHDLDPKEDEMIDMCIEVSDEIYLETMARLEKSHPDLNFECKAFNLMSDLAMLMNKSFGWSHGELVDHMISMENRMEDNDYE